MLELASPLLYDRCIRRFQTPAEREAEGRKKGYAGVLEADLERGEAKLAALARERAQGEVGDEEDAPESKEEGHERWKREMEWRFVMGEDEEFDYGRVDRSEEWDERRVEEREEEERYFEGEEVAWVEPEGELRGETGVQDY
jgi:hypothetical protein